jgi:hypothetical protein
MVAALPSVTEYVELLNCTEELGDATAKLALTPTGAFPVTVHGPVPLQALPVQPVKLEPPAAVAVRVTTVPTG